VEARFVAVVGASGSGKSSFIRAGVVAGIWNGALPASAHARVLLLTPRERPLEELGLRLASLHGFAAGSLVDDLRADPRRLRLATRQALLDAPDDARIVIVVDQFEELFTLCRDDADRRRFVHALLHAWRGEERLLVLLAVRADFYGRLAAFPELAAVMQDHQALVGPMTAKDLRRVVEEPAAVAGLTLEPGLTDSILEDLSTQPGALPLLSHALLETWKRRSGRALTVAGYRASSGVRGAIAQTAERTFEQLDPTRQATARMILLSLTEVGEGTEPTRRPVTRSELTSHPKLAPAVEEVIDILADARLITVDQDTVQVAHEALIRHWPTLRRWLDDDRESLRVRRGLSHAARDWNRLGRDPGALYRGARLAAANDWADDHDSELNALEREFLDASRAAEQSELDTARRRARRLRILASALAALVLATGAAAVLAVNAQRRAESQRQLALSRSLASQALANIDQDVDLAALLSLEAYRTKESIEAQNAILTILPRLERSAGVLMAHRSVGAAAFSPDGRTLAVADGAVRLWDVAARRPLGDPLGHHILSAAFSPDGHTLASAGDDGTVRLWDVATRRELGPPLEGHKGAVTHVAFSPDGDMLASAGYDDKTVRLWDAVTRRPVGTPLKGHTGRVTDVAFSPDGRTLASAGDQTVRLWDVVARRERGAPLRGHLEAFGVAFSPDGRTLASVGDAHDGSVLLWDLAAHPPRSHAFRGSTNAVSKVAFSPDGRTLAAGGTGNTVRLWDVTGRRPLGAPLRGHTDLVYDVAFSRNGTLASASADGTVRIWKTAPRQAFSHPLIGHTDFVNDVAFSPDGRTLASASADSTVRIWDVPTRRPLAAPLRGHYGSVNDVAFSPDGRMLASAGSDGFVEQWNVIARQAPRGPLDDPFANVGASSGVEFSPDGRTLAASGDDGVRLWDVATRRSLGDPLVGETAVEDVTFSPDGRVLAAPEDDGTVRLWNFAARRSLGAPLRDDATRVAFSPDGRTLASAGSDGAVRLWDLATRRELGAPLKGHTESVNDVAFSPDGRTLASASDDATVRLWDVATRRPLGLPLRGHTGPVYGVAFSRDWRALASAGDDKTVRLWHSILWTHSLRAFQEKVCPSVRSSLRADEWKEFMPGEPYRATCPRP
jgi:WD40 repeat protein